MEWFAHLENRRSTIIFLVLFLALAVLAASALREPFALDSYWHLKMGQDLIEKGFSPFRDHYSITQYGDKIVDPPFLFQIAIYGLVSLFGLVSGFKAFVLISSLLALGSFFIWLRKIKAPLPVLAICVFMLLVVLQLKVMVRPELLSYSLVIISLIFYENARKNPSTTNFLYIVIFMLFWRNYHSAVLGYVVFFGLFVDIALQHLAARASLRTWATWAFWGLLVFSVGFLSPDLSHPVWVAMMAPQEWYGLIDEYRPALQGQVNLATLALIPIAIFTLLSLLYQRLFGYFLICAIFSGYAFTIHRMTAPGGIVIVSLFALVMTRYDLQAMLASGSPVRGRAVTGALLIMFSAALLSSVLTARDLIAKNQKMLGYLPDQLVAYMKEHDLQGRILNEYAVGGYLIYHLGDTSRVFVDGRAATLYPIEHVKRGAVAMTSPDQMRSVIEEFEIDYLVTLNKRASVDTVHNAGGMQLDYSDMRYSLYARENANLPVSGSLWSMPWCWNQYAGDALITEKDKTLGLVPKYSPVAHFVTLASEYHLEKDPYAYLQSIPNENFRDWYDDNLRFAGYRALEHGLNELAIELFYSVRGKQFKDFMAGATANLLAGRLEEAELILAQSFNIQWVLSDPNDVEMLYRVVTHLQSVKELELIDQSYVDQVRILADHEGEGVAPQSLTFQIFCQ